MNSISRRFALRVLVLLLGLLGLSPRMQAAIPEARGGPEFTGPCASWKNVKTDYGAKGDGKADDTAAIQRALDDLRLHKAACVLYVPAGTYRITSTVKTTRAEHHDGMGVSVVGEDPATTTIRWNGKPGGTVFQYDAWFSTIRRLTLDGAGTAGIALAYGDGFSTYNETADMVFKDVGVGLQMATGDKGQAENAVLRCAFLRCSVAGIRTSNYNSLDVWAWHCRFEDCDYGLYDATGNFHAYGNLFLRSKTMDIGSASLMVFAFSDNTSIGSRCFMDWRGQYVWGSPCSITRNRIINPTGDFAIALGNAGPWLVMDNVFKARAGVNTPQVLMTWGQQVLAGNRYSVANPVAESGRFTRFDEQVVDPATIDTNPPALPPTPPRVQRRVFEVAPGADAAAIQAAIDAAATLPGQRPVVHVPMGTYAIAQTLRIPAGCDVQLIGDGAAQTATVLNWTGAEGGTVLRLEGPSLAELKDLAVTVNAPGGTGILVEDADQPGGGVFANQLAPSGLGVGREPAAGLLVNGMADSDVQMRCLQGGTDCATWIKVVGQGESDSGEKRPVPRGQVAVYTGASSTSLHQYDVEAGGQLLVRSVYHEIHRPEVAQAILLKDSGSLFVDSTRFSYKVDPQTPLVKTDGFRGHVVISTPLYLSVGTAEPARLEVAGDGRATRFLGLGMQVMVPGRQMGSVERQPVLAETAQPAAAAVVLNSVFCGDSASAPLGDQGGWTVEFLREMLAPLREARLWEPGARPAGVTDVRLHRIASTAGLGGVAVELRSGGWASSSGGPGASVPAQAFDGSTHSAWCIGAPSGWLQFNYAAGGAPVITGYSLTATEAGVSGIAGADGDPRDWQLQGSNDGTTWTILDAQTGRDLGGRAETTRYTLAKPGAYRFVRLNVTANHGAPNCLQLAEMQLIHAGAVAAKALP